MVRAAGAFWLDGLSSRHHPPLPDCLRATPYLHSLQSRSVAIQEWTRSRNLLFQSTAEDPGAPFECLGLDLAPGHIVKWNYLI